MNGRSSESRFGVYGYYVFLVTAILSPLIFWPSGFVAIDTIKTIMITLGTLVSAVLIGIDSLKRGSIMMPPRRIAVVSILVVCSLVLSAIFSANFGKSFFGQGFEINTVSFIGILFLSALVAFSLVIEKLERAVYIYVSAFVTFLVVYLHQFLRVIFGPKFATFGFLNSASSTILGSWSDIGTISCVILAISLSALFLIPITKRFKIGFWAVTILSVVAIILVNNLPAILAAFLVTIGITVLSSAIKWRGAESKSLIVFVRGIAWKQLILAIIFGLLFFLSANIQIPLVNALKIANNEVSLSWQTTLDVTVASLKASPIFGVGTNHFVQSYMQNKPAGINETQFFAADFPFGLGFISTLISEQGLFGLVLWILFFVFFAISGGRAFRQLPSDPLPKFVVVSSYVAAAFLWLVAIISVPGHAVLFLTFVLTGVFFGAATASGIFAQESIRGGRLVIIIFILLSLFTAFFAIKKTSALYYFGSGVKQLNANNDGDAALLAFERAYSMDKLDVYLQGMSEAVLNNAAKSKTVASSSELVNQALKYATAAVNSDPSDYYNYISMARVAEFAASLNMQNSYETAIAAYEKAIELSPRNPSIYLNLAKLAFNQKKYDDALKAVGAALQTKSNYLDAVYLASQIYVAKGELDNAITATKFALQMTPNNPQLMFQLGILQYNNRQYEDAEKTLEAVITAQPDYANAQYFLGLTYARLGDTKKAIAVFGQLSKNNPDNAEVLTILKNLSAGKSIFDGNIGAELSSKKSTLPIKQKK